jgi:hypothetical protein
MYTEIVVAVAQGMGYVERRSCCTGGEISYAFSSHGSLSILFEQGRSFQPSYEDTMAELETENWPGILGFWRLPTPAYGHVSTPCNSRCRLISFSMCTAFRIDFPPPSHRLS